MRKLFRLMAAGAFLTLTLLLPSRSTQADETTDGCIVWYDEFGFCYYSCSPGGDGYC